MIVNKYCVDFVFILAFLVANQPIDCVLAIPIAISTDDDLYERPILISSAHQDPRRNDHYHHHNIFSYSSFSSTPSPPSASASSFPPSSITSTENASALSSTKKVFHLPPSNNEILNKNKNIEKSFSSISVNEKSNSTNNSTSKYGRSDEKGSSSSSSSPTSASSSSSSSSSSVSLVSKKNSSSLTNTSLSSYGLTSVDLIQPLTLLLMSYLSSRNAFTKSNNNNHNNNYSNYLNPQSGSRNSDTESRTLASWLSNFAKRLKWRGQQPNRRDNSGPPPTTEDVGGQSVPIPYESIHHQISMNHRIQPASSGPNSVVFSNLIPQPEGFPGPMNPDSILLPPDLVENSGIKYWLDLIEKSNGEDMQSAFQTAGTDNTNDDISYGQIRPNRRHRLRPTVNNKSRLRPLDISKMGFSHTVDANHDRHHHQHHHQQHNSDSDDNDVGRGDGYDSNKINHATTVNDQSPRCDKFTSHICVDDFEYPEQAIIDEIYKRRDIFELMYSEVKGDAPLVDGIPRDVEESYNYENYYTGNEIDRNDDDGNRGSDPMSSGGSDRGKHGSSESINNRDNKAGFICPSEVLYGKPKLARNIRGDWKVIVNAGEFTQTVRMEKCLKPNDPCNYIRNQEVSSRCAQVHSFHRLMVFEKGKGFYIDSFRIPTACTCHVSKKNFGPNPMSAFIDAQNSKPPTHSTPHLSNTLWSILGGNHDSVGSSGTGSNGISPFSSLENVNSINSDLLKTQLNVLETLKNYPQLTGQISSAQDNSNNNMMQHFNSGEGNHLNTFSDKSFNINSPQSENVIRSNAIGLGGGGGNGGGGGRIGMQNSHSNIANSGPENSHHHHHDDTGNSNSGDSTVEYVLPGMMYAEEPLSFPGQESGNSHLGNSYTRGASGSSGAPLVQVIHVPITSSVPQNYPIFKQYGEDYGAAYASASHSNAESLKSEAKAAFYGANVADEEQTNGHSHGVVNRQGDDIRDDKFYFPKRNNHTNNSIEPASLAYEANSNGLDTFEDHLMMISGNNSTGYGITRRNTLENNASSSSSSSSSPSDKVKINFSYHPILEYIQKPSKSSEGEHPQS